MTLLTNIKLSSAAQELDYSRLLFADNISNFYFSQSVFSRSEVYSLTIYPVIEGHIITSTNNKSLSRYILASKIESQYFCPLIIGLQMLYLLGKINDSFLIRNGYERFLKKSQSLRSLLEN